MPTDATSDPLEVAKEARETALRAMLQADQAVLIATGADGKSDSALRISQTAQDTVMGLAVAQEKTTVLLNDHRVKSEERHVEVMGAIGGAQAAVKAREKIDTLHEAKIVELTANVSKLSGADVAKASGAAVAVGTLLLAVAGLINALIPVAPGILQSRYGSPVVVVTGASSAPPATIPTGAP